MAWMAWCGRTHGVCRALLSSSCACDATNDDTMEACSHASCGMFCGTRRSAERAEPSDGGTVGWHVRRTVLRGCPALRCACVARGVQERCPVPRGNDEMHHIPQVGEPQSSS